MATDAERIAIVVSYALAQLGKPYSYTASPPNSWDCSKLTAAAYAQIGIKLTPYTYVQEKEMVPIPGVTPGSTANLQQGDLLFFFKNNTHHVSMYIGNDEIVEASSPATGVRTAETWYQWNVTNFSFARRAKGIGSISDPAPDPGNGGGGNDGGNDSNQRVVKTTRQVGRGAVALSGVYGTPQTARFAALNTTNETVYLNISDGGDTISGAENGLLQVVANTVSAGDSYEIVRNISGGKNSYEISIDTEMIQSQSQAEAVASMISRSFSYRYKAINVKIFGNPLIQIGDIVKFNFYSGKVTSSSDEYYIVTKVSHDFNQGLDTTLTIKPLIQTVAVV
jgi:hypothetical protein